MTLDFKETGRPPTVASPVSQYPGTCSSDSVDRQNDGAPVLHAVTCLLLYVRQYMRFLHTVKHFRIVSYRDILCDIVSYHIVSLMYRAITILYATFLHHSHPNPNPSLTLTLTLTYPNPGQVHFRTT